MSQFNPVITKRTPSDTVFAEVFLSPGPQAIGVTGQNRLQDFIGQEWMLLVDKATREVQLWQENGSWSRVRVPGHPLIDGVAPEGSRRFTLCFDQSARPIAAYEVGNLVLVTRWDAAMQEYIQNVTFAGTDPVLFFDAVLGDPAGFPDAERAAAEAGIPVSFVWEPDGERYTNAMGDSDVVVFYLSPDRMSLCARVQRELYQQVHVLASFGEPVIMDRALNVGGQYQLLISGADGSPVDALVSDPYLSGFIISPSATESLSAGVVPESIAQVGELFPYGVVESLSAGVVPENIAQVGNLLTYPLAEGLSAGVAPEGMQQVGNMFPHAAGDGLAGGVVPEDAVGRYDTYPHAEREELSASVQPESIRVQAV